MKRVLILFVLLAVFGALWWMFSTHGKKVEEEGVYFGYGEGELVYVAAPLAGQLVTLDVKRGQTVEKGAALFALEREQEKAARAEASETMREATARLDKARLDYERAKGLRDKRVIASEDYDSAEQAFLGAQHSVAARQQSLAQADWKFTQKQQPAPTAGLVYDTYYRAGEWVTAGSPIVSLLPPEYMKVRFFVPESDLGRIPVGTKISILMDGLDEPLSGEVSYVSPRAEYTLPIIYSRENRQKLVFLVEGSLPPEQAKRLHPGAPVEVRLTGHE